MTYELKEKIKTEDTCMSTENSYIITTEDGTYIATAYGGNITYKARISASYTLKTKL